MSDSKIKIQLTIAYLLTIFIFHYLQPISILNCLYFDQERHHEQNQQHNHTKQHTLEAMNKYLKSAFTSQFFNPTSHIYKRETLQWSSIII